MMYDSWRGRIVLFGGGKISFWELADDTWEWDGVRWREACASHTQACGGPAPLAAAAMVFDSTHGTGVLFGGFDDVPTVHQETWL